MNELLCQRWFTRGRPREILKTLFPAAMGALIEEDRRLRELFDSCPRIHDAKPGEHPGLAYGLFETTLVYLVFKAWLRHTHVEWESRYSDKHARRVDLVVLQPRLYFEAKWWGSMQGKVLHALRNDVQRLRAAEDADGRYLLTFWWNFDRNVGEDEREIYELDQRLGAEGIWPRYYARFRTIVRHERQADAHFSMCAFEVQ